MPRPDDDLRLVRRLLARDGDAWREFVSRFERLVLGRVLATARELGRPLQPTDAEDLCAEVFSALLANEMASLRSFEGRSRLSTWLTVVARRVCLKRMRRLGREIEADVAAAVDAGPDEVVDRLVLDEESLRLAEELDELEPRDRELLRLIYEEGEPYGVVADRLGVAVNSVGPLLHRARARLRERMTRARNVHGRPSHPTPVP